MSRCPYCGADALMTICRCPSPPRREVNTQNHQRVNAEAMKRAYSEEYVEVPQGRLGQLMELVAEGWVAPTALARMYEKDVPPLEEPPMPPSTIAYLESLRDRAIEEAGISAQVRSFGRGDLQPPPPARPAPKCPPSCTPVEPCKRWNCLTEAYLTGEASKARFMAIGDESRRKAREAHAPPLPRPEARRIGAADLSFGRWNGRAPR